jgi:chromosome segregation ATPase
MTPHPHDESEPCPGGCDDIKTVESDICKAKSDIEKLNKRIQDGHDQMQRFEARLDEGNHRMGRIENTLTANAVKLDVNTNETTEILEILRNGKALFKLANHATAFIKWGLGLGASVLIFWAALKDWPKH